MIYALGNQQKKPEESGVCNKKVIKLALNSIKSESNNEVKKIKRQQKKKGNKKVRGLKKA